MHDTQGSRRAFIAGLAVATTTLASCGAGGGSGASASSAGGLAASSTPISTATGLGEIVRIAGESGLVAGKIVDISPGVMGGVRPAGLRSETLIINFQLASGTAPIGNMTYGVDRTIAGLQQLFLTRGEDVNGQTVMTAILN